MRIVFLGNNWLGWQVVRWLREQREQLVALVVHPPSKERYREEIIASAEIDPAYVFDATQMHSSQVLQAISEVKPDLSVSVLFGYILRPGFLALMPAGCVNLHPALLPFNRGAYPNVWSIVEKTPAGATLHYMDAGIDTGDIIAQRHVAVDPADTGETLYRKLEQTALSLFRESWPLVRSGKAAGHRQPAGQGTYHRARDVQQIDEIDLDRTYTAGQLIDVIRARTFPPYPGAYFWQNGRKVYVRLQLLYEDELGKSDGAVD